MTPASASVLDLRGRCWTCGRSIPSERPERKYCGRYCKDVQAWLGALARSLKLVAFSPDEVGDYAVNFLRHDIFTVANSLPVPRRHRVRGAGGRFAKRAA